MLYAKVFVEWLTLLLGIRVVPRSNLGVKISYPHYGFCGFPQSFQAMPGRYSHS
jgi:hypothetical protein